MIRKMRLKTGHAHFLSGTLKFGGACPACSLIRITKLRPVYRYQFYHPCSYHYSLSSLHAQSPCEKGCHISHILPHHSLVTLPLNGTLKDSFTFSSVPTLLFVISDFHFIKYQPFHNGAPPFRFFSSLSYLDG